MKLVIIESPGKIKSFKKYLGHEYDVVATFGHCIDLPKKKFAIDLKNNFEPTFEVIPEKKDVIKELKSKAKQASDIFIATDPDREGEGIAHNIYDILKETIHSPVYRIVTHEITEKGIKEAISHKGEIDNDKYNAYLTRRILDRIVGYKTSFLTKQATGGTSAGRVQSAILRVIVDREKEILAFVPEEYWALTAALLNSEKHPFLAKLTDSIKVHNCAEAQKIYDAVSKGLPLVTDVERKETKVSPYAPFTTLPMIATASTLFGWGAERTMKVAQSLYEQSLISYHRTDSPFLSDSAVSNIRETISHEYGSPYLPTKPMFYSAKKGAQEAHEACRPTDFSVRLTSGNDESKLYQIIWKRAVASQMNNGNDEKIKALIDINKYEFIARGSRILFDGFRKCWDYSIGNDVILPKLTVNEKCSWDKHFKLVGEE